MMLAPPGAPAAAIIGGTADTDVRSDGVLATTTNNTLVAGASGSPLLDRSSVLVFQLPDFGAVANPFTSASLRLRLASKTGTPPNLDLYGLGRRASATVLASDYYGQNAAADPTDATLLQSNVLVSTTANGPVYTNSSGATALRNYLNAQYAGGAGAGQHVFLRLSTDATSTSARSYTLTSANAGADGPRIIYNIPSGFTRPFIWVRDSEKAGILAKIANNPWATSVYSGIVSRVAPDVAAHQSNRDTFLRALPVVDWAAATPKFKTIPAYSESSVRYPAEQKFNDAQDCAILYYLTGDEKYARCAADILHNVVKTMLATPASSSTGNGGWIFQDDLLKEARVTGPQMAIVYDLLHPWLQSNQVYDVKAAAMVNFNFTSAQSYFRKYYQLVRDHGQKDSNWSALMATTMLNNLLALDDATERSTAIQVYLTTGTSRQASLDYDYRHYQEAGDIWPESLQYAGAVGDIRTTHLVLLERVNPGLNLFDSYPNLPLSLPRISYLRYPSNNEQISFGDGYRPGGGQPFGGYELVYQHAKARGRTDLGTFFGSLINGGVAAGQYDRSNLTSYGSLSMRDEPLQLLWQSDVISEPSVAPELPRTDTLPFAGIALQRNLPATDSSTYGLMGFVGGAGHVHSHASGMSMELFGLGEVMGAKSGRDDYQSTIHEKYYRLFASNNTVIVNGASQGDGGWSDIEINKVQTLAMEPAAAAPAVSPDFSFTCSSFADNKGTLAAGTQQRTLAIVRTSPTTGYYVDIFRSKSTVTNRTATTLDGPVTNQYHDYIYRNIGETTVDLLADGAPLPLTSQSNRFQNDIGDAYDQPGWRYFTNTRVSHPTGQSVRARFDATVSGVTRSMSMHMPAVASREYARVESPAIVDAPAPYDSRVAPTLVVRQIGEAWNKAFATVYEPHFASTGGTVEEVTQLLRSGAVVGVKVESTVAGKNLVHYILSNPNPTETYTDAAIGLTFKGRFGIASNNGDGTTTLYLGEGSFLAYQGNTLATVSGSNSQAEARFTPGLAPVVTANAAVNAIAAPPPPGSTWIPAAAGTYSWNSTASWNPAVIPNNTGYVARKNIDLTGSQTVNLDIPVTLGELVVGDSSGSQATTLQQGTAGAITFDQDENAIAYLTRSAGGTGTVTFAADLGISLADKLTVRLAGGSSASGMHIAGTIAGSGKGLTKEGSGLTLTLSGANTYSGDTAITAGILDLGNSLALQNSTLDATTSAAGDATTGLRTSLTSLTLGGLSGSKNLASLFTTVSGGYGSIATLTLNPGSGATPSYSGIIANGAPGMGLTKSGGGTQTLTGSHTYTGNTTLAANSGTLVIGGTGRLGGGTYSGAIAIGSGSILDHASSAAQQLNGPLSGTGLLRKSVASGELILGASNSSFTGGVNLETGTIVLAHANALGGATALTLANGAALKTSVQNATLAAAVSTSGTPVIHAPDFGTGSTVSTLTLNGPITGSGGITFSSESSVASNSNQTIRLNAQSTYTGSTTLAPSGNDSNLFVKLGIANALPATTVLSINGAAGGGTGRDSVLDLNGFSQTIAGLQNTAASLRIQQIANTGGSPVTLTINNPAARTFSGSITGSNLGLVKNGTGTQTLAGSNSYSGATVINAGKFRGVTGGNCASSAVTLANSAATLGVSITDNTKTWTCAALATPAAGTIEFDYGTLLPGTVKSLTVTGLASFTATPAIRVVVNSPPTAGTYPLMSWGSSSGTPPAAVSVVKSNGSPGLADSSIATLAIAGNTLNLVVSASPSIVKANNTNNLNLGTSWTGGTAPGPTSTARWNNSVTAANTTVLGADTTWGGIAVDNPGGNVTINAGHSLTLGANSVDIGMSAATADLTLNCPLVLGDENTWSVASNRTLTLAGALSGAFPVVKEGGGTALLTANNPFTGDISLAENSGTFEIGGSGRLGGGTHTAAIDLGSGSTFRTNSSAAQSLNGTLGGDGTLSKNNSGTLTLGGDNSSFTGPILLNAGTLRLAATQALGGAASLTFTGSAVLSSELSGISTAVPITLGPAGTTSTLAFGLSTAARGSITFNGTINGAGSLTITTPNNNSGNNLQTIFLGSANTYGGSTVLTTGNAGNTLTVRATTAAVLPATTVLTLNGGNGSGSGRTISFDLNGFDQTIAGLSNTTGLTLRNQRIFNTGGQPATLSIHNTANHSFSGNINGTALSLDKAGTGTQTLAGSNAHTGITSVSEGILALGHALALQNSALETAASITGDAANGLRTTVTTLTLGGLVGDKNLASLFTTASGGYSGLTSLTLNPGASETHEYTGAITEGAAGMSLVKAAPGTQILAGANSYTGDTIVTAGTLALGANNVLPNATDLAIGNATLNAGTFTDTLSTLDVTGIATLNLGTGAKLAFSDSSAIDWTGGTLNLTGTFAPGGPNGSLRFGTTSGGLTDDQLLKITATGYTAFDLDANGYLIATVVTSYSSWQSANGTTQEQGLDHDNDGVPNGIEHFLGGTTNTTGFNPLPGVTNTAGTLSVTWVMHATYTGSYDTDFVVETSATLDGPWTAEPADPDPGFTVTFPSASEVRFTFPPGSKNFARLRVMP